MSTEITTTLQRGLLLLGLQILVLVPLYAVKRKRLRGRWIGPSVLWIVMSAAVFFGLIHFSGQQYSQ